MRRDGSRPRAALWRRRLLATAVVALFHVAVFGVIVRDWSMRPVPARLDTIEITLERPDRSKTAQPRPERRPPAPIPAPQAAGPASSSAPAPATPLASVPYAGARAAAPAPSGSPPAADVALNIGCLGRARELMTAAERRRCDRERSQLARAPAYSLPPKLPPTALDREFAAALAKRRENDPSPRAPRPRNCQLENITGCAIEDSTWTLLDGHGTGSLQKLMQRITGEEPPEKPAAKAGSVFGREEVTFTPIPMK